MLKKLLKHELHATGRNMWIVCLAVILLIAAEVGVAAVVSNNLYAMEDEPVISVILFFALLIGFLASAAAVLLTLALMVHRFYKNFLSDEGYLMFTLPVNLHQLVWSKLLIGMLWQTVVLLLVIGGVVLSFTCLLSGLAELAGVESLFTLEELFGYVEVNLPLACVQIIVGWIVSCGVGLLEFYCVMAIGYGFAKNKALMSVVLYFAIQLILSILGGAVSAIAMLTAGDAGIVGSMMELTYSQQWHLTLLSSVAISVVMGAIFYCLTIWNLKKRLNLS